MQGKIKIRDPIHGFINLEGQAIKILDTQIFQRLRYIHQLAFASFVYPGALNTRFDHSLGVFHVTNQMVDALNLKEETSYSNDILNIIRYSALLHDIGHGPFSHVSEVVIDYFSPLRKNNIPIHELMSGNLIRTDKALIKILGEDTCNAVATLLLEGYQEPINKAIISGPIDADKLDYLLRDSYYCGVKYGIYDINQLITEFEKVRDPADGRLDLGISDDGIKALEQYLLAKYYLSSQVYRHRVRLITDQFLIRAIIVGIEKDNIKEMREIFEFKENDQYLENYKQWNDHKFLLAFGPEGRYKKKKCAEMIKNFLCRKLFKQIYLNKTDNLSYKVKLELTDILKPEKKQARKKIEKEIAQIISIELGKDIDEDFVVLHSFTSELIDHKSENDIGKLLIVPSFKKEYTDNKIDQKSNKSRNMYKLFESESGLYKSIKDSLAEEKIAIYAPLDYDDISKKEMLLQRLEKPLTDLLNNIL
jgi:HD superfamily phosphohydrolase